MRIAILHSGDLESVSMGGVDRYVKSIIEFMPNADITVFGTGKHGKIVLGRKYKRNYHGKDFEFIPITDDKRRPLSVFYMLKEISYVKELGEYDCIYAQRTEYSIPFMFSKNKKKLIQLIHGSSKYSEIGFGNKMAKVHLLLEKMAIGIAKNTYIILNRDEFGVPYYKEKYPKYADRIRYQRNPINPENYLPADKFKTREMCIRDRLSPMFMYPLMLLNTRGMWTRLVCFVFWRLYILPVWIRPAVYIRHPHLNCMERLRKFPRMRILRSILIAHMLWQNSMAIG